MDYLPRMHAPLFPLAVSLALGIGVGHFLSPDIPLLLLLILLTLLSILMYRRPVAQSVSIWACFLLLGLLIAPKGEPRQVPDGVLTEAVVVSAPAEKPKTIRVDLQLTATGERRRSYIWKDERSQLLAVGDNILVSFHDEQFIGRHDWQLGGNGFSHLSRFQRLKVKALRVRSHLLSRFHSQSADDEAPQAVLLAMVLGDKSGLTPQLRHAYDVSGASHILALSGLHLGIIYMLLTGLMMGRRRFWLGQVVVVLAIWAYSFLTGLSTSVTRAAIMISIYSLFLLGGRRHAPLGVLSFAAMVLLLADPHSLTDIGFQLSFMSMLSILFFVPLLEQLLPVKWLQEHRMARWLIGMVMVSVAAQLGTAPLVAYHFGRFSTWFLLANLVAIPLAMFILYGAILVLIIPPLLGLILALVRTLNAALDAISQLPFASINGLHPSPLQVLMLYVLIIAVYGLLCLLVSRINLSRTRDI